MTNSIHDMGGMHGFGPVEAEPNEPLFHAPWEARVRAMQRAMGHTRLWTIDGFRAAQEVLPPLTYLESSYYERWFRAMERLVVAHGLVGEDEFAAGRSLRPGLRLNRKLTLDDVKKGGFGSFERPASAPARFKEGDSVRTRNINPTTHTRLPRYARGKVGTIEALRGCHVFPDSAAIGPTDQVRGLEAHGDNPQFLYTVVFSARELWGEEADPTVSVSIEAFEPYLAPE